MLNNSLKLFLHVATSYIRIVYIRREKYRAVKLCLISSANILVYSTRTLSHHCWQNVRENYEPKIMKKQINKSFPSTHKASNRGYVHNTLTSV